MGDLEDKSIAMAYFKTCFKKLVACLAESGSSEDHVNAVKCQSTVFAKKFLALVKSGKDVSYYAGESDDPDGMVVAVVWNDDGMSGVAHCMKNALKEEKV